MNWSEHVQKGRCGMKAGTGDRVHPAQQGSCKWRWYFSTNAKSVPEQWWAVAWLKTHESPSAHEKAACFHTLTPPAPCTYIQSQSCQPQELLFLQWSSFSFRLSQQRQTAQFASRYNNQSAFWESQERKHLNSSRWGLKTLAPEMKGTRTKKRSQNFIQLNRDIRVRFSP